jgi:hypothetical protein
MHTLYNSIGLALCGIALVMLLAAYLKGKRKREDAK